MNKHFLKDEIRQSMEHNLYLKLQYFPSKLTSMSIKKIGQTLVVDSGMPIAIANTAYGGIVSHKVANDVMQYYLKQKLPMVWWIGSFLVQNKDIESYMQAAGFTYTGLKIGMYRDLANNDIRSYKIPDKLIIKECFSEKDFSDFGKVLASTFEPGCDQVETFYKKVSTIPIQDRENFRLFIGYANDEPVVTTSVFFSNVAGIYGVSTRPDMQGKGYGSAMVYTALKFALDSGYKDIVGQSSQNGLAIYKKFGFEEICEYNVWSNRNVL